MPPVLVEFFYTEGSNSIDIRGINFRKELQYFGLFLSLQVFLRFPTARKGFTGLIANIDLPQANFAKKPQSPCKTVKAKAKINKS